jgi:DNA repair protein RadD
MSAFAAATLTWDDPAPIPLRVDYLQAAPLRPYQLKLVLEVARLMRLGYRRILIQLPTGGGKTKMAAALMGCTADLGLNSEFIVHRKELITQTSRSFTDEGLSHGFIASKRPMDLTHSTILAGVQTLVNRLDGLLPPDVAIVDECHHATSETWARVMAYYGDAFIIGLTATPRRLDGRGLDEQFDIMIRGPSIAWLIENRYLSPYEYYAPSIPDMTDVPVTAGEFQRAATAEIMGSTKVIGNVVEHYLRLAPGEQGIVFAPNRECSRKYADAFKAHGIPAMHVDGDTPDDERDWFDDAFRAGDVRLGINVDLFGEGYDVPNISYLGDAAPSMSEIKVAQRRGRPLRMSPGKTRAIMCDHAGNAIPTDLGGRGHGLPDDEVEYSLAGRPKRGKGTPSDADPVTQCKKCYRMYKSVQRVCPGCGETPPVQARAIKEEDGKLTKLEREALQKAATERRKAEEKECRTFAEFLSLGKARGHKQVRGWAKIQCRLRRIPVPPS